MGPVISPVPWFSTISSAPQRPQNLWASLWWNPHSAQ